MDNEPTADEPPAHPPPSSDAAEATRDSAGTRDDLAVHNASQDMEIMLEATPLVDRDRDRIVSRIMENLKRIPAGARAEFIANYWPGPPPVVDADGMPVRETKRLRLL